MGTQERRVREKAEKKLRILESARALFEEKGVLEVTMNDIAQATEYSIGALYGMFKSKNDIYLGLAGLGAKKVDALISKYLEEAQHVAPTDEHLESFVFQFVEIFSHYGNYFDVLRLSVRELDLTQFSPDVLEMLSTCTLNSLATSTGYFSRQLQAASVAAGKPGLSKDDCEEAAVGATFTSWCLLLGLSQVMAFGRGLLVNDGKKSAMLGMVSSLIKDGLARTSFELQSQQRSSPEQDGLLAEGGAPLEVPSDVATFPHGALKSDLASSKSKKGANDILKQTAPSVSELSM